MNVSSTLTNLNSFFPKYPSLLPNWTGLLSPVKFFNPDLKLVESLKIAQPLEFKEMLNKVFHGMIEEGSIENSIALLENLAKQIPYETIQKADRGDAIKELKSLVKEAELCIQATQHKSSSAILEALTSVLNAVVALMESISASLGIRDLLQPSENAIHDAMIKSQKIMSLMFVLSALAPVVGGAVVGEFFLGIALLSLLWPSIKPIPAYIPPGAENWTQEIRNGSLAAYGRKESLDAIAGILNMNRHAILVGPSRVGKSLTAKAFALAIERGDYPELKGKTVFRFNMADLIDQQASMIGGSNKTLHEISKAMGRHRKNIVLVLDEVHMACKNNQKMADQLKPFLDEGGEFPYVIGITTDTEYHKHVKENQAFSLRFDKVDIKDTNQNETLAILGEALIKSRAKPLVAHGNILQYIYDKSSKEKSPQPAAALKLLKKCIHATEQSQLSPTEKKVSILSNQILALRSQETLRLSKNRDVQTKIVALEEEMKKLQKVLNSEKQEKKHLFQAKAAFDVFKAQMYRTTLKMANVAESKLSTSEQKNVKLFSLLHTFLGPFLESYIQEKSQKLGLKMVIDSKLVDEMAKA